MHIKIITSIALLAQLSLFAAQPENPENNKRKREDTPATAASAAAENGASVPTAATAAAASAPAASQAASEQENPAKKARTEPKPATDELLSLIRAGDIPKIKAYIASQAHLPLAERTEQWTKYLFKTNNKEILTIILDSIDINYICPTRGTTHLIVAAANNHTVLVELLLQKKADPNAQNKHGETALMFASNNKNLKIVRLLLAAGAKATTQSNSGHTSLSVAYKPLLHNTPENVQNRSTIIGALKLAAHDQIIKSSVELYSSMLEKENSFNIMLAERIEAVITPAIRDGVKQSFQEKYKKELVNLVKPGLESILLGAHTPAVETISPVPVASSVSGYYNSWSCSIMAVSNNLEYALVRTSLASPYQLCYIDKEKKQISISAQLRHNDKSPPAITEAIFVQNNKFLITTFDDGNELAWIWHVENLTAPQRIAVLKRPDNKSLAKSLALSPNNNYLAIGCRDNRLFIWDIRDIQNPKLIYSTGGTSKFAKGVTKISFSPDSSMFAVVSGGKPHFSIGSINDAFEIKKYDMKTYLPVNWMRPINNVEFIDKKNEFVLVSGDRKTILFNIRNNSEQLVEESTSPSRVNKIFFTPDRKNGFSTTWNYMCLWNFEEPQRINFTHFSGPNSNFNRIVALSADGRYMLRQSDNHTATYISDLQSTQSWIINHLNLSQLFLLLLLDKKHNKRVDLLLQDPYHKLIFDGLNPLFRQHLLKIGARALIDDYSGNALKAKELQNIIVDYLTDIPEESAAPIPAATVSTAPSASPSASATAAVSANGKYTVAQN